MDTAVKIKKSMYWSYNPPSSSTKTRNEKYYMSLLDGHEILVERHNGESGNTSLSEIGIGMTSYSV